jgi:hypothetical protein
MPALPPRRGSSSPSPAESNPDHADVGDEVSLPLTRLEIRDLSSKGARRFLKSVDASSILEDAVKTVHKILTPEKQGTPDVRSITLILRSFGGVAYTTGKDIDFEHKEIHLSTEYIEGIAAGRLTAEITGVLVHEMVHVWQWNGQHSCNGGLIEGVADWVRLKAGLAPPHWRKRSDDCDWDAGYDVTAYFLEWLEVDFGKDVVVRMNQKLRSEYAEDKYWPELCDGQDVKLLWARYASGLSEKKRQNGREAGEQTDGPTENQEENQIKLTTEVNGSGK